MKAKRFAEASMSKKLILALAVSFAAFGSVETFADEPGAGYRHYHRYKHSHHVVPYRGGVYGIGGHRFGDQNTPYVYYNNGYSNSPYFENRTFWERVETQADYPVR
jgi:hypothetical protein